MSKLTYAELVAAGRDARTIAVDVVPTATELLAQRPRYGGSWCLQGTWWTKQDDAHLRVLCEANAPLDKCADLLARDPKTLVHRALDQGYHPSRDWRGLPPRIRKPKVPRLHVPRAPQSILAFPYIVKARDEHADILRVNAIVPKGLPDHMRADVCQNIMLAVLEGKATIEALERTRSDVTWYIKRFYREQSPYQEVLGIGSDDDERGYDEIAAAANVAWHESAVEEHNTTRRYYSALRTFSPPTQENDVYVNQVEAARVDLARDGNFLSWGEAQAELERGA